MTSHAAALKQTKAKFKEKDTFTPQIDTKSHAIALRQAIQAQKGALQNREQNNKHFREAEGLDSDKTSEYSQERFMSKFLIRSSDRTSNVGHSGHHSRHSSLPTPDIIVGKHGEHTNFSFGDLDCKCKQANFCCLDLLSVFSLKFA